MLAAVENMLRSRGRYAVGVRRLPAAQMIAAGVLCGAFYGCIMGSYGGWSLGVLYAAIKVPMLLAVTTAVCAPNFWVMNRLLGLGEDFVHAMKGILATQVTAAVVLAALTPVTAFFYGSRPSYPFALAQNACMFGLAALAGQITLSRHYGPLVAKNPEHRRALAAWFVLYGFVAIKLASILRPFVGDPRLPAGQFFREEAFSENPYASLWWTLVGLFWKLAQRFFE